MRKRIVRVVGGLLVSAAVASAQTPGAIVGVVRSSDGAALAETRVRAVEAGREVRTGSDGRFVLAVPPGRYTVLVSRVGYGAQAREGVAVAAGDTVRLAVVLRPQTTSLGTLVVAAEGGPGSVARALGEQRRAPTVLAVLAAEHLARAPDGDAAAAARRVSGVVVEDGKYLAVRGLAERYTITALNGARLPSPEPERKLVPLDLFPTALLEGIRATKTFTPDLPGDVAGGLVDLRTRDYPRRPLRRLSVGSGLTAGLTGRAVLLPPGDPWADWVGLAAARRGVPPAVAAAGTLEGLTPTQTNALVRSFRNVWTPRPRPAALPAALGLALGGSRTGPAHRGRLGYLLSFAYHRGVEAERGARRAQALAEGDRARPVDAFVGDAHRVGVLWGGLASLGWEGAAGRVRWDLTTTHSADSEARRELGQLENFGDLPLRVDRLRYVERTATATHVEAETTRGRHALRARLGATELRRREPDRSEIVYAVDARGPFWLAGSSEAAVRTFGDLRERATEIELRDRLRLREAIMLEAGWRRYRAHRRADNRAYSLAAPGTLPDSARRLPPEAIFDGRFAGPQDRILRLTSLSVGGAYRATQTVDAVYVLVDARRRALRLVGGVRGERARLRVASQPTFRDPGTSDRTDVDLLPSLALTWRLPVGQLRAGLSRTLARPEYRETVPILTRDLIGGEMTLGNPGLRRSRILNVDARWEVFPNAGELLAVGVFAKRFRDPIETVYVATSGTRLRRPENAAAATALGLEVEAQLELGRWSPALEGWSLGANLTRLASRVRQAEAQRGRLRDGRPLVGQPPSVVNLALTYAPRDGLAAGLLLHRTGPRLVSPGEAPLPDVRETARSSLDAAVRLPLRGAWSLKLDAKNLTDAPVRLTQGPVERARYRAGRSLSVAVIWQPDGPTNP